MSPVLKPLVDAVNKIDNPALYRSILKSIDAHGQMMPILLGPNGEVLEGRLRMRACKELGIDPKTVRAANDDELTVWHATNVVRRHLSIAERTLLALEMSKLRKPGDNGHTAGISQEDAAKAFAVSVDSIGRAKKILEQDPKMLPRIVAGASLEGLLREISQGAEAKHAAKLARGNRGAKLALTTAIKSGVHAGVVYADPPWDYGKSTGRVGWAGSPRTRYPTMTLEQIKAMPIKHLAGKDAVLWLWVPNCLIPDGIEVMKAWGFDYVTDLVWQKTACMTTPGAVKPHHETVLVGKRGAGVKHRGKPAPSYYAAKRTVHSAKPDWFAKQIERMYPKTAKVELFCRSPRKGWLAIGNQVNTVTAKRSKP